MIRVGSQLTFCSPDRILPRAVVQQDEQNIITRIFSLDDENVEPFNTLFFDGILSAEIVSIQQNLQVVGITNILKDYNYFYISESVTSNGLEPSDKPLVLDFGTNLTDKINHFLPLLTDALSAFSIFEIIAACTFYPSLLLGQTAGLNVGRHTRLMLWESVDLINKKLSGNTYIREMNSFSPMG